MSQKYIVGSCVKLKSSNQNMTIYSYNAETDEHDESYTCHGFIGKYFQAGNFSPESLEEVEKENSHGC